jgi:hypothetical protein
MILERLDRPFCRVYAVVVRFDQQELALLRGEELFDLLACLIIHDVYFHRESFALEELKLLFVSFKYRRIFHVRYWQTQYRIRLIMIYDEEANVASERHEWEGSRQVAIHDSCLLVGERGETEYVACGGGVIVFDDVGTSRRGSAPLA